MRSGSVRYLKRRVVAILCTGVAGLLAACGTPVKSSTGSSPFDARPLHDGENRSKLRVIVQTCVPNRRVSFEILPADLTGTKLPETLGEIKARTRGVSYGQGLDHEDEPIDEALDVLDRAKRGPDHVDLRRVKLPDGEKLRDITMLATGEILLSGDLYKQRSEGGGWDYLRGATIEGQPVYEARYFIVGELVATSVRSFEGGYSEKWFKPPSPSAIPIGRFTGWQAPTSSGRNREHAAAPWSNDTELPKTTPETPLKRYMLLSAQEDFDDSREGSRERDWVIAHFPSENDISGFIRQWDDSIPPCAVGSP